MGLCVCQHPGIIFSSLLKNTTQGPRSKFLSGGLFLTPLFFVKLFFVKFIFVFAKKWGGGGRGLRPAQPLPTGDKSVEPDLDYTQQPQEKNPRLINKKEEQKSVCYKLFFICVTFIYARVIDRCLCSHSTHSQVSRIV